MAEIEKEKSSVKDWYTSYKNVFLHVYASDQEWGLEVICEVPAGQTVQRTCIFETSKPYSEFGVFSCDNPSLERITREIHKGKWVVPEYLANDRYPAGTYGQNGRIIAQPYFGGVFNPLNWVKP